MSKSKINKYLVSTLPRQQDRIEENFRALKLRGMVASYERIAQSALEQSWTPFQIIEHLQQAEITWSEDNRFDRWLQQAHFEVRKTLEEFDFSYPKKINRVQIQELASCRFIDRAQNVAFLGPTGVGKTHLAIAIGIKAIEKGHETRFIGLRTLNELIDKIGGDTFELRKLLDSLTKPKLLILDEIALSSSTQTVAKFLTELILNRYKKSSTIFTSNKQFRSWINVFGDQHTSAMVIDRVHEQATSILIEGESYRVKDRVKILSTNQAAYEQL